MRIRVWLTPTSSFTKGADDPHYFFSFGFAAICIERYQFIKNSESGTIIFYHHITIEVLLHTTKIQHDRTHPLLLWIRGPGPLLGGPPSCIGICSLGYAVVEVGITCQQWCAQGVSFFRRNTFGAD